MTKPVKMALQSRRKFDRSFKEQAVALWLKSDKPASVIAEELGINSNQLYAWKNKFAPARPETRRTLAELEAELAAMRKELERVRLQRDILKKSLGIVSESPLNGLSEFNR